MLASTVDAHVATRRIRQLAKLDAELPYGGALNHEEEVDPYLLGAQNAITLVAAAERARRLARSYRNFRVGAAGLALYYRLGTGEVQNIRYIHGANIKPSSGGEINIHAEDVLTMRAIAAKANEQGVIIPAFAIVGDVQPDQQSGLMSSTLHPCGVCRTKFMGPDNPIWPETTVITANSSLTEFQWFSVGSLVRYHDSGGKDGVIEGVSYPETPLVLRRGHLDRRVEEMASSGKDVFRTLQLPIVNHYINESAARR